MINRIINKGLFHPFLFNTIRSIVAGDQRHTKQFVANALAKINAKTILDIGCGTGDFASTIPKNATYEGIDISSAFVRYAKQKYEKYPHLTFSVQDATDPSFYKRKKYDAVIFISMLHHLSDAQLKTILPLVHYCKPKIIIIVDIIPNPKGLLQKLMVKLDAGNYIRPSKDKLHLLSRYFILRHSEIIPSRLAVQMGILCTS
jgi:2-polyprenyl-3-methyl-5-hydroxy-6-metoxy-1,4-benzoquinol methylase